MFLRLWKGVSLMWDIIRCHYYAAFAVSCIYVSSSATEIELLM